MISKFMDKIPNLHGFGAAILHFCTDKEISRLMMMLRVASAGRKNIFGPLTKHNTDILPCR